MRAIRLLTMMLAASCDAWCWSSSSSARCSSSSPFLSPTRTTSSLPSSHTTSFSGAFIPMNGIPSTQTLTMRKQKASDKRTRRQQRNNNKNANEFSSTATTTATMTRSPMQAATWRSKSTTTSTTTPKKSGGRGRSRKRSNLYQVLQHYQNQFLRFLTMEYKTEEETILNRITKRDPVRLEQSGYALFDMGLEYRGRFYAEHIYRLTKQSSHDLQNHKFNNNDLILLTEQPHGRGDVFGAVPLSKSEILQGRILNQGPKYLDIVLAERILDNETKRSYYRVDQFISPVSYERMVNALSQLTTLSNTNATIRMDDTIREAILSTYAFTSVSSPLRGDPDICQLEDLSHRLSRPPMGSSERLADQALRYLEESHLFPDFNAPQRTAIQAALTRRMTMIQGPPGTGKTTVAAAIGFGFVHQCRSLSAHTKVLACAFSNVGADNLAEALIQLGLKVVRVGKPSAVAESLRDYTLDAAIQRDPFAKKALDEAGKASARLKASAKHRKSSTDRVLRDLTTAAVKASIQAANVAATKALRAADVIVSTNTGAADAQLLAACGINANVPDLTERSRAPDGMAPISLPFVIVDEACQSVEPATLIPVLASNSCRSLVLLGDPCQLPPTVINSESNELSVSLMERLAATLPHPGVIPPADESMSKDDRYLDSLPIKQAASFLRSQSKNKYQRSYRKVYNGALLLSVQYRMHPSIAALPSTLFYNGLLSTPRFLANKRQLPKALQRLMPCGTEELAVRLINVGDGNGERQGVPNSLAELDTAVPTNNENINEQTSYWNEVEARRVVSLVKEVLVDSTISSIGIVSPYNGQVQLIKSLLASDEDVKVLLEKHPTSIEVKSVDGYQGRERDIIIFSTVRSNRNGRIGFLNDWRRMNVALTRARSGQIIVGDFYTLSSADHHWGALLKWASGVGCVLDEKEKDEVSLLK